MAQTTLQVCIGEPAIRVGTLIFENAGNREHSVFRYSDDWLAHPRRFALEPGLPLDDQRRFFKAEAANASPLPRALAARIETSAGLPVAIIGRFDRTPRGRRPYISAQTLLESPVADGATYARLTEAIRERCVAPRETLAELFGRVAFTILVSNVDDHLKNHGFLYVADGQWALSPMFDVNPAPERFRELKTAIADASVPDASIELLLEHVRFFDLGRDAAAAAVKDMARTIVDEWRGLAADAGMSTKERGAFEDAFVHAESRYALAL